MPEEWKSRSLYEFIRRVIKQVVVIIEAYHVCQLHTKFYPATARLSRDGRAVPWP